MFVLFHELQVFCDCFGNFVSHVNVRFLVECSVIELSVALVGIESFVHDGSARCFVGRFDDNVGGFGKPRKSVPLVFGKIVRNLGRLYVLNITFYDVN